MSRTRQWYYDGATIPGATGKTVVVGAGQLNAALWECRTQVDYGADSVAALAGIGGASFSPLSLFASGEEGAWYDPSDLSTLWKDTAGTDPVTTAGDTVARVDDKSGNGNNLTQDTLAARPVYQTSGGLHWLEFDGVDDRLGPVAYSSTLANITRAVGFEFNGLDFVIDNDDSVNRASLVSTVDGNLRWGVNGAGGGNLITGTGGWTRGAALVAVATADSDSNLTLSGSGNPATGTSATAPADITGIYLGTYGGSPGSSTNNLEGRVYGVVDLSRVVTANERTALETYLAEKTGVTL